MKMTGIRAKGRLFGNTSILYVVLTIGKLCCDITVGTSCLCRAKERLFGNTSILCVVLTVGKLCCDITVSTSCLCRAKGRLFVTHPYCVLYSLPASCVTT